MVLFTTTKSGFEIQSCQCPRLSASGHRHPPGM